MDLSIKLNANEWNVVLFYLSNGKYSDVVNIIAKIKEQGDTQVNNTVIVDTPKE